jgi:hypothetical protein
MNELLPQENDSLEISNPLVVKAIKYGATILGVILVAPVAVAFINGAISLMMAGIVGAIGFALIGLAPVASLKFANFKERAIQQENVDNIKKITAAARENPIPTLYVDLAIRQKEASEFEDRVAKNDALYKKNIRKTSDFIKQYSENDPAITTLKEQLQLHEQAIKAQVAQLDIVKKSVAQYESTVKRADDLWEISKGIQEANDILENQQDIFSRIRKDTALDAVENSVNLAFSQMRMSLVGKEKDVTPLSNALETNTEAVPLIEDIK